MLTKRFKCLLLVCLLCAPLMTGFSAQAYAELAGGWALQEEYPEIELPEAVQKAFDENLNTVGAHYQPILYLATQVVAGINHMVLCKMTLVTESPFEKLVSVVLYEDQTGYAFVRSIVDIDLLSLIEEPT